jgi:biopolymer transport protein ExbB
MKLKAENRILLEDAIYLSDVYDELRFELDLIVQKAGGGMMADGKVARSANSDDLLQKADSLSNGFDQIEALFGGEVTQAKAIGRQGEVLIGSAYNLGPVSWFLSTTGQDAGILTSEYSGGLPSLNYEDTGDVSLLFNGEPVELDVDLTGGKARAIAAIQSDPLELLKKGGVWLWPILVIALISVFCGIMKFLQLAKIREPDSQWCARILSAVRSGDLDLAKKIAQSCTHPAAEVISTSIGFISAGADVVEEVVYEHLIGVQSHLQKWLPFIAITAATAPLLGLLGTVSGMIRMFNVITITGTGDVKPMAGGISEALVTTLFGLVVAIPALILHTMLSRKSYGVVQNTEKLGLTFVNGLRKL